MTKVAPPSLLIHPLAPASDRSRWRGSKGKAKPSLWIVPLCACAAAILSMCGVMYAGIMPQVVASAIGMGVGKRMSSLLELQSRLDSHVDVMELRQVVALAKAEFALMHPFEPYPPIIASCEARIVEAAARAAEAEAASSRPRIRRRGKTEGTKNTTTTTPPMLYENTVMKHGALGGLIPLDMPEIILRDLLGTKEKGSKAKRRAAVIFDVGANVGQFALPLAKMGHTVYSFEPDSRTCQTLKQNVRSEMDPEGGDMATRGGSVHVTCVGVDNVESVRSFGYVGPNDPGSASYALVDPELPGTHVTSTVQTGPVHRFIDPTVIGTIDVFKTDTQGNELAVLSGAKELLSRPDHPRFLLVEFSHTLLKLAKTDPMDLLVLIYGFGYVCTHLVYQHPTQIGKDNAILYERVDTPESMTLSGSGVGAGIVDFEKLVHSVGIHSEWRKFGIDVNPSVRDRGGWTDLLCFG